VATDATTEETKRHDIDREGTTKVTADAMRTSWEASGDETSTVTRTRALGAAKKFLRKASSDGDRDALGEVTKLARRLLMDAHRDFRVGDVVYFDHTRTEARIKGPITRINRKSVKVSSWTNAAGRDHGWLAEWTVAAALLRKAEEDEA